MLSLIQVSHTPVLQSRKMFRCTGSTVQKMGILRGRRIFLRLRYDEPRKKEAGMKRFVIYCALVFLPGVEAAMAGNLEKAKSFFDQLNAQNMHLVDQFYDEKVHFQDPVHSLKGAKAVKSYYERLYQNVQSIRFVYGKGIEAEDTVSLPWAMHLKTAALNSGKEMTVDGVSIIRFNAEGKVIEHRDYFDMGEFVYERLPILKSLIRYIKGRLAGDKVNEG